MEKDTLHFVIKLLICIYARYGHREMILILCEEGINATQNCKTCNMVIYLRRYLQPTRQDQLMLGFESLQSAIASSKR